MRTDHKTFMALAIEEALTGVQAGEQPFGAVVVRDGEIVCRTHSTVNSTADPTAHAEMTAVRKAAGNLETPRLKGCTLYASCEPCAMCVATMYQVGIERLFYAGAASDSADFFQRLAEHDPKWARRMSSAELRREVGLPIEQRQMPASQLLVEDTRRCFEDFIARHGQGS